MTNRNTRPPIIICGDGYLPLPPAIVAEIPHIWSYEALDGLRTLRGLAEENSNPVLGVLLDNSVKDRSSNITGPSYSVIF